MILSINSAILTFLKFLSNFPKHFKVFIFFWKALKIGGSAQKQGRIWDLIVSVPDHCLSFYLARLAETQVFF